METTESCTLCEHSVLTLKAKERISGLFELPNTYDSQHQEYRWRREELMSYAIIPRSVDGRTGTVDFFLCIDEDVMDDIDVFGFARRFVQEQILPSWRKFRSAEITEPCLAPPREVKCWKFHHRITDATQ